MPANHRQVMSQAPASSNAKQGTARYTNKDGSKIITVPKGPPSTEPSLPSTPTSSAKAPSVQTAGTNGADAPAPVVNRKKQKRREKAAAKAAAGQAAVQMPNGRPSPAPGALAPKPQAPQHDHDQDLSDDEAEDHLSQDPAPSANGVAPAKSKKNKKKKKKKNAKNPDLSNAQFDNEPHPHSPLAPRRSGISKDKIWNTSSQEERERIKEFWLGLGEDERKSLVKVEKDAVLKKMKEQQKHTCSCTVCGRKRTAIEEELEGLYDAYYEELESFAHQGEAPAMLDPRAAFPTRPSRIPGGYYSGQPASRGRIVEDVDHDDDDEEEHEHEHEHEHDHEPDPEEDYSDDQEDFDEEEEYSEEELPEDAQHHDRDVADFLTFGNSLQVKGMKLLDSLLCRYGNMDLGGILTVADDLLKNDGKRFIEMMEQLAERRMAREEDAKEHFSRYSSVNGSYQSPPADDEDYDDEDGEEDDDYDDSQDEYEDEEDTMTEAQRMEEGRRMFQIFAARMFEQRVLTAYRDMVAKQRQQQLIEDEEDFLRKEAEKKAKKAIQNQKKKDKAALKKQQQAEEKARKEAEKAAEEAARLEEQKRKAEEQRLKAEEKRRKKEEQKRLEEEERLRKEAERIRRQQEQQERERKAREAKEKAQKLKELRDKETREQKEKETRERKEKQEQAKRDREQKAKADKESKERLKQEEKTAPKAATVAAAPIPIPNQGRRPSQHPVPIPTHPSNPGSYASPKIPVATPAIPKAPTPIRPKNASQPQETSLPGSQASQSGSTASQNPSPHPATPGHTSPAPIGSRKGSVATTSSLAHPQSVSPSNVKGPLGVGPQPGSYGMPMSMPPPGFSGPPPGLANHPVFGPPHGIAGFGRPPPGMMPGPPGLNPPLGRGFVPQPPPGFSQPMGDPIHNMGPSPGSHSRQASGSFDSAPSPAPAQPIGRPAPIGRPGSAMQGQRKDHQIDEFSSPHLGSRALLDGSEDPMSAAINAARQRNQAPRPAFPSIPFDGIDNGYIMHNSNIWGTPAPFAQPPPGLVNPLVNPWPTMMSPMAPMSQMRPAINPGAVRSQLCRVCKELQARNTQTPNPFIDLSEVKAELSRMEIISEEDLLNLTETEGNSHNGGGTFEVQRDANGPGKHTVRWVPESSDSSQRHHRAVGAPGEIGSPIIGGSSVAFPARGL